MKDVPGNELLSAYLDGELNAAEQAEVERLLAENAHARQLLDELRALSTSLQALPQHKLEEDFPERVLRAAERRILTDEQLARPAERKPRPLVRRFFTPRAVIWSGLAVAVAVMLMVFAPDELQKPGDVELAKRPAPAAEPAPADDFVPPTIRPTREEAEAPADADEEAFADREAPGETPVASEIAKSAKAPMEKPSAAAPTVVQPVEESLAPTVTGREIAAEGRAMPRKGGAPIATKDGSLVAGKADVGAKAEHGILRGTGGLPMGGFAPAAPQRAAEGVPTDQAAPAAATPPGVLLVQCDVSPEAVRQQAFDKLLLANGIAWEEDEYGGGARAKEPQAKAARPSSLDQEQAYEQRQELSAARRGAQQRPGALDVVYVEATPAQLEATLSQLNAQPRQFLTVSIQPAPDVVSQRPLSRFSRAGPPAAPKNEAASGFKTRFAQPDATLGARSVRSQQDRSGAMRGMDQRALQPGRARRVQLSDDRLDVAGQVEGFQYRKSGLGDRPRAARDAETLPEKSNRAEQVTKKKAALNEAPAGPREPFGGRKQTPAEQLQSTVQGRQAPPTDARQQLRRRKSDEQPQQPATYRALFVLRMVGSPAPGGAGAAAAPMEEADAAKPARANAAETKE